MYRKLYVGVEMRRGAQTLWLRLRLPVERFLFFRGGEWEKDAGLNFSDSVPQCSVET